MACPSCGIENLSSASRCRICGRELIPTATAEHGKVRCNICGASNPLGSRKCSVCMKDIALPPIEVPKQSRSRDVLYYPREARDVERPSTRTALMGGLLVFVSGFLAFGWIFVAVLAIGAFDLESSEELVPYLGFGAALAIVAMIGGIGAMMRRWWPLAELSAIIACGLSVFFSGFCCILQLLVAFAGLVLVSISRREFE